MRKLTAKATLSDMRRGPVGLRDPEGLKLAEQIVQLYSELYEISVQDLYALVAGHGPFTAFVCTTCSSRLLVPKAEEGPTAHEALRALKTSLRQQAHNKANDLIKLLEKTP